MNNQSLLLLLALTLLISCKVEVQFPSAFVSENEVILDGINLKDHIAEEESHSTVEVSSGLVDVSINGETRQVNIKKDGLLNLTEEEYVVMPIMYSTAASTQNSMNIPLIVDSIVYQPKNSILKQLNKGEFDPKQAIELASKKFNSRRIESFKSGVIQSTDFFVEKCWDYDIGEEVPEEISIRVSKNSRNAVETKSMLMQGSLFRVYAMISDEYDIYDLRDYKEELAKETVAEE